MSKRKIQPGMIEFSIGMPVPILGAVQAIRQSGKLRKTWRNTMTAGHLAQVQGYGSFMNRANDPLANWAARKFANPGG